MSNIWYAMLMLTMDKDVNKNNITTVYVFIGNICMYVFIDGKCFNFSHILDTSINTNFI